ncbi:MAG: hypothetical protein L0H83_00830 [Salinisphaera sp.]|nr:hypothetical protein [Salinisphaera sp.]
MCGLAGRILHSPGAVGNDVVELMEAQKHRGADSTGFAVFGAPRDSGYVLRCMGFNRGRLAKDMEMFREILKEHGSDYLEEPALLTDECKHYFVRMVIRDPDDVGKWLKDADSMLAHFEVQSCGRSLEIVKDEGDARAVADKHGVRDMVGTHALGHARLATESSVLPNASHPFWARPFPDVAIVHNGQITDYHLWRARLMRSGYRFLTENDSELIAVWVSDQIDKGLSPMAALEKSISAFDGVFTYLIADEQGVGYAKDRFAIKPLAVIHERDGVAIATEEQAVRRIYPDQWRVDNIDGPSLFGIWDVHKRSEAA